MMGTYVEVVSGDRNAAPIVFQELKRIEDLLSKYSSNSEVAQLNRSGRLKVSPDTFYVIKKSVEFYRASAGAFDITTAPLVELWGFSEHKYRMPKDGEIKDALRLVGADKIILHEADYVVEFKTPGMKIDLGGIAKGYAVDCAVNKLKIAGIKSCLVNAGGQIYCLGDKHGQPWKVAVRNPRGRGVTEYLKLKDKSVATSGDYEQYFIRHNIRYAHILDPGTGYPASGGIAAVTVIADNGITADALSTAIFVLGKDKGQELAKKFPEVRVKIIEER